MTTLLVIFIIAMFLAERYYLRHGLQHIYYDTEVSQSLLEPNEKFVIRSTVENHKALFVPYVSMTETLPLGIQIPGEQENVSDDAPSNVYIANVTPYSEQTTGSHLRSSFYLMPYQKFSREVTAFLPNRGRFLLRGCSMSGGDLLGLADSFQQFPLTKEIVVMPNRLDCPALDTLLGDFLGDISVNRFIFEDPMLTIGFSEYSGREPQRDISWNQSARMGRMMVKNYDHTVDTSVSILLNVQSVANHYEDEAAIETCISMTRSICETLEEKRIKYGFYTNAVLAGSLSSSFSSIEQGLGSRHFYSVMEALGRAAPIGSAGFDRTLLRACRTSEQGRYHIIITPEIHAAWEEPLHLLQKLSTGHVILLTPSSVKNNQPQDSAKEDEIA